VEHPQQRARPNKTLAARNTPRGWGVIQPAEAVGVTLGIPFEPLRTPTFSENGVILQRQPIWPVF